MSQQQLPDYVASATPNPFENRAGWLTTTAATYAGIMLWFVFWTGLPHGGTAGGAGALGAGVAGGVLSQGLLFALVSLVIAAFICFLCFYYVPAMLGMKTGLPLYIVGTSTYGVQGGFYMPGFLMGVLQFGWLSVNGFFAGLGFALLAGQPAGGIMHIAIGIVWSVIAALIGLKGIKYVGMVATYMPIIPIVSLLVLLVATISGVFSFNPQSAIDACVAANADAKPVGLWGSGTLGSLAGQLGVLALICTYIVGFFATAGAAGCDMGSHNKDRGAIQLAGLVGIAGATIFAGGIALVAIAGAKGMGWADITLSPYASLSAILGTQMGGVFILLLAIAAFPAACFSSLIAANSFKATLPKVNPFISCGIGTAAACVLIVTGLAGDAGAVFKFIGASFGPICGAMMADYLLSGKKWAGPRAGFNLPGWISWGVGFLVGGLPILGILDTVIPCPPVAAFVVGFALYYILAKAGLESPKLDMPQRIDLETNS